MNIFSYFKKIQISAAIAVAVLLGSIGVPFAVPVSAAFNPEINYQGKLADSLGAPVADGTYQIAFNLYTASSSGVALWTETRSGANEVQVTNGLFSVMLGEVSTLAGVDFNQTLYLGVTIEADSEMTPRKKLGAVTAAFEADRLDGLDSSRFLRTDTANATSTTNTALIITQNGTGDIVNFFDGTTEAFTILDGGNVGIGTTTPYAKLSVNGTIVGSNFVGTTTATSTFGGGINIATGCFAVNGVCVGAGGGSGTVNSGTLGQLAFYSANGTAVTGTSTLFITPSSHVGVGTTSATSTLDVWGNLNVGTSSNGILFANSGTQRVLFGTGATYVNATPCGNSSLFIGPVGDVGTADQCAGLNVTQDIGGFNIMRVGDVGGSAAVEFGQDGVNNGYFATKGSNPIFFAPSEAGGTYFDTASTRNLVLRSAFTYNAALPNSTYKLDIQSSGVAGGLRVYDQTAVTGSTTVLVQEGAGQSLREVFGIYANDGITPRLVVQNGNVGIGTTSPYAKLSVNGQIVAASIISTTSATSTFGGGINIATGCFAIGGSCISGGGGAGTPGGSDGQLQFKSGSSFGADSNLYWDNVNKRLGIGSSTPGYTLSVGGTTSVQYLVVGTPSALPNAIVNIATSVDSYLQVAVQNKSASTAASTDFVATNDLGSDSRYYVDLGINSSAYNNPLYTITGPNDAYLYNSDGALALGTASTTNTNAVLKFHTGGTLATNERMRIDAVGNVAIGTTTASEKLTVAGNILIGARTASSGAVVKVSPATAGTIASGGTSSIASTSAMAVFNGSLYVGTFKADGAEVYRYDGGATWTKVSGGSAGTIASGGTANIDGISAMMVWDGSLYASTVEPGAAEVYRYDGNSAWTRISSSTAGVVGGISTTTAIDDIGAMAVNGGYLYIGTSKPGAAEVYRYNGNAADNRYAWTKVSHSSPGTIGSVTIVDKINTLASYQGVLYAGGQKSNQGALFRYDGMPNVTNLGGFTMVNSVSGTFSGTGTSTPNAITQVDSVRSMVVFDGKLYLALNESINNMMRLVKWDGNMAAGGNFQQVSAGTGVVAEDGAATNGIDYIGSMAIYNDMLYVGTGGSDNAAELYRLDKGSTWTKVSFLTAGVLQTGGGGTPSISGVSSMMQFGDDLFLGSGKLNEAEVYKYNQVEGLSNTLQFAAASNEADGEQNGFINKGTIQFIAENTANNNIGNANTGKFVFSHGINTATGAYDIAEDYPTRDETLAPGDVVSIDASERVMVKKSKGKNDQNIIGIYSSEPALRLSQVDSHIDGAKAVPIALAGRVPANVTLENGSIEIGDYLVASNEPGKAAKATRPGRVIGRALTAYSGAEGEIAKVTVFIGVETITWNDIAEAEETTEELTSVDADTSPDSLLEFVSQVNEAVSDMAFAFMNKADNLTLVIVNKITAVVAQIQELFVSKLVIVPNGNIAVPRGENQIAGSGVIEAGEKEVFIANTQIDDFSMISITPTSATDAPLYVYEKKTQQGFTVRMEKIMETDVTFDWFSIKTYDYEEQQTVISEDDEEVESAEADPEEEVGEEAENESEETGTSTPTEVDASTDTETNESEPEENTEEPTEVEETEDEIEADSDEPEEEQEEMQEEESGEEAPQETESDGGEDSGEESGESDGGDAGGSE